MANNAFMIDKYGVKTFVNKKEITKELRNNDFYCCGYSKKKGGFCEAPLEVSALGHFYQATQAHPHMSDCPCSKKSSTIRSSVLDTRAQGLKMSDLLYRLGREKTPPTPGPAGPGTPKNVTEEEEDDSSNKPVVQRRKNPKNIPELVKLLSTLSLDDYYTNTTVKNIILDERTESLYRTIGLPENTPMVVLARKTNPKAFGVDVGRGQWLLADYWAVGNNRNCPVLFLLNADGKTRKMLADCTKYDKSVKIAVFATWKKHPRYNNVFVSSFVNYNLVGIIGDDND